ncbi:MAG: NYN domain-containing protein, partial [Nitrospirota bacterium]
MHIIIDGYNLIGIKGGMWADLEPQRERLLSDLERYRKIKGNPVTVVFDGWRSGLPVEREERTRGIKVIFTRTGEKADQVINRIVQEYIKNIQNISIHKDLILMEKENVPAVRNDLPLEEVTFVVFDLETSGQTIKEKIIEIGALKIKN